MHRQPCRFVRFNVFRHCQMRRYTGFNMEPSCCVLKVVVTSKSCKACTVYSFTTTRRLILMVLGFDEINLASFFRHCSGQRNSSSFARNFHGAVVPKLSPTPHV